MEKKKKPLLTDEFLDKLALEINEEFGGPEFKKEIEKKMDNSKNESKQ